MNITVDDIMALGPCYPRHEVEAMFGEREFATPTDIATTGKVSTEDKDLCRNPRDLLLGEVLSRGQEAAGRGAGGEEAEEVSTLVILACLIAIAWCIAAIVCRGKE